MPVWLEIQRVQETYETAYHLLLIVVNCCHLPSLISCHPKSHQLLSTRHLLQACVLHHDSFFVCASSLELLPCAIHHTVMAIRFRRLLDVLRIIYLMPAMLW